MKRIESSYVAAGRVRIVSFSMGNRLSDRVKGNTESEDAARAASAAADQNMYWVYHDFLFGHQGRVNSGAFSVAHLLEGAVAVGLDLKTFQSAFSSIRVKDLVDRDERAGKLRGVQIVPTVFVNGAMIADEQPFEQYQTEIEKALAATPERKN